MWSGLDKDRLSHPQELWLLIQGSSRIRTELEIWEEELSLGPVRVTPGNLKTLEKVKATSRMSLCGRLLQFS